MARKPAYESYTSPDGMTSWARWRSFGTKDRTKPLPYHAVFRKASNGTASNMAEPNFNRTLSIQTDAYNAAYADFVDLVKDKVNMAVNVAELGQTYDLIADAVTGIGNVLGGMRRGNIRQFKQGLKQLRVKPSSLREFNQNFSSTWLAYQYAISPAIGDVTKLVNDKILFPDNRTRLIEAKRSRSGSVSFTAGSTSFTQTHKWTVILSADVTLSNPSLYKNSQTGLTNPFALAYELIPYSFVLDWFVNLGDIANAIDDFAGVTLSDPHTTILCRGKATRDLYYGVGPHYIDNFEKFEMWRTLSPPTGPRLALTWPISSPKRLLNALALAIPGLQA